jgi:hypothetical protein
LVGVALLTLAVLIQEETSAPHHPTLAGVVCDSALVVVLMAMAVVVLLTPGDPARPLVLRNRVHDQPPALKAARATAIGAALIAVAAGVTAILQS